MKDKKIQKLTEISRLYYEQYKTQSEIAKIYHISRPLVSRMLKEAREYGIVNIEIRSPFDDSELIRSQLKSMFEIKAVVTVPEESNDNSTNAVLAEKAMEYLHKIKGKNLGIGWGTIIGVFVSILEKKVPEKGELNCIFPLVGNSSVSNRNYHSNEIIRIVSQQMGAYPSYLYTPAFAETLQELELIQRLENYKSVKRKWEKMDIALVNIGNYPSVPDFASGARYGQLLVKRKAAGRILAYYYDEEGAVIQSDTDYAIQIPIDILRNCKNVVGICSSNVKPKALAGAIRTGLIQHIIVKETLLKETMELLR